MKKKYFKKIVLNLRVYIILFVFCILIILVVCFSSLEKVKGINYNLFNGEQVINNNFYLCTDFISNSSEVDKHVVNSIFANGMNMDSFMNVCNYKSEYVSFNNSYKKIDYDFDKMLHYSDIEEILFNANNSDVVNLEVIGKSVDNRNIYGVEVGFGNKVIFLDANIHAAEVASVTFLTKFLNDLVYLYEIGDSSVINALNNFKIVLIPSLNPDGYEVYNFGIESINNKNLWIYENKDIINFRTFKFNANGIDLNRNFPTQNAGLYYNEKNLISSVSLEKSVKNYSYFGGSELGSEPETQAAMYFILKHYKNTYYYINMHSQGRVIYAGKPNLSNDFNVNTLNFANNVSNITNYKLHGLSSEEVGEGNDGTITDFFAEMAHEFKFSSETLRLSTNSYIGEVQLKHETAVITLETLDDYTTDISVFKNEYYNKGIEKLLFSLLDIYR